MLIVLIIVECIDLRDLLVVKNEVLLCDPRSVLISDLGAAKVEKGQVKGDVKKAKLRHRLKLVDVDVKKSKQSCRS